MQLVTEESATAAADQLLAAEQAAAAQAEAKKAKKQRRKAKKEQSADSETPEETHQSEQNRGAYESHKALHVQGAAEAQHAQHEMRGKSAEASAAELALADEPLHMHPVQHDTSVSHPEASLPPITMCEAGLQPVAAFALVSSNCEERSLPMSVLTTSQQRPRSWSRCPITKVGHPVCTACCLFINCQHPLCSML